MYNKWSTKHLIRTEASPKIYWWGAEKSILTSLNLASVQNQQKQRQKKKKKRTVWIGPDEDNIVPSN